MHRINVIFILLLASPLSEFGARSDDICFDHIQESSEIWTEPEPQKFDSPDQNTDTSRPVVTFWNKSGKDIELVWDNPNGKAKDQNWGILPPGKSAGYSSNRYHRWVGRDPKTGKTLQEIFITEDKKDYTFLKQRVYDERKQQDAKEREKFRSLYEEETGRKWLSVYPRDPPRVFMWEPVKRGYRQIARTTAAFWHNKTAEDCDDFDPEEGKNSEVEKNQKTEQDPEVEKDPALEEDSKIEEKPEAEPNGKFHVPPAEALTVTVETLSLSPAVFAFYDVMSHDEADLIIKIAEKKGMKRSLVTSTGVVSEARTSNNTWISHNENPVITNVFNRIADLMNIERIELTPGHMAESIQVAHYAEGQEYKDHHDFLEPLMHKDNGRIQAGFNRLATFLFYLNDVEEGGQTAFPLADPDPDNPDNKGATILLPKGSAILFYNMLPDGNLDQMCLHAGRPPAKGEKYIANLWLWDPKFA